MAMLERRLGLIKILVCLNLTSGALNFHKMFSFAQMTKSLMYTVNITIVMSSSVFTEPEETQGLKC